MKNLLVRYQVFIFLVALTLIGGLLRLYQNDKNPISLSIDEVAFGYNAYSVLKTGRDEYGKFLPITFKSVGDYKNPVVVYTMIPSIYFLGLNAFSIRLPTALIATLSIPLFYLLFVLITRNKKYAIGATLLLAISPWHIYYSRYISDHLIALAFVVCGMISFLKMIEGKKFWVIPAAIFLVGSMYTYHAERLFIPIFSLALIVLYFRQINANRKIFLLFVISACILVLPLVYSTIFGPDKARVQMTLIIKDIEFQRNVAFKTYSINNTYQFLTSTNAPLLFFYWVRKYLYYIHPGFLFYSGLNMTTNGILGLGIMYIFEIPWLILGIITLLKKKVLNYRLIFAWVLIGLIPASLTLNEQHPSRSFLILPMTLLISSVGMFSFFNLIKKNLSKYSYPIYFLFTLLIIWNLLFAFLVFKVHFPKQKGEDFMEGTKETVEYALANQDKYQEIVFDPRRGIYGPDIVSIPHMYILFYSKYDPYKYQTEEKIHGNNFTSFDKYTIREIDWRVDRNKKGTLFIGSPWSLQEKNLKEGEILKRVYLSGGDLAFLIVSPKP